MSGGNGLWWLFTNMRENQGALNDELFLYYSDDLFSDHWEAHPLNPIVTDAARHVRPAGSLIWTGCSTPSRTLQCYGYAVKSNRILGMDEKRLQGGPGPRRDAEGVPRLQQAAHLQPHPRPDGGGHLHCPLEVIPNR
jgi:hypothetical protein